MSDALAVEILFTMTFWEILLVRSLQKIYQKLTDDDRGYLERKCDEREDERPHDL